MAVRVICFFQPGCMGCMEQTPINLEVGKVLNIEIEEIDAVKNPQYIKEYQLKVTPTIVVIKDGEVKERLEGVVHREQLESTLKKYR
ncbi:MAG: thioredoxin family protein [Methanoregula sp.]|nr:thioredoxin family protein [Methanoregula sp.]